MEEINKKRSETMKKRWKEGRFNNRNLKGILHPWNIGKKGTFVRGHKHSEETKQKVSRTRIERGVARREKNPAYTGGSGRLPYPTEFKHKRKSILERDSYICQLCKDKLIDKRTKGIKWAAVHHVDYDKFNNNNNNLVALCNFCNLSVNKNREDWTKFFRGKLNG